MSEQLLHFFLADAGVRLDEDSTEGEPKLLWKVVLRTGTWKLRPGPGGVKLKEPLKIFRDKAPKGHISMAALVKNFVGDDKGPAKEHVTVPMVHADGTVSDGGFVKKLVIQDVFGEDGSKVKESLLWAGMEITDSELQRKLSEKSIRGVSGGILFDYQRTEDAKKFDQILSHVMVTNSPWINGTGDFKDKLPEGVMASEPTDLPVGELEPEDAELPLQTEAPGADPDPSVKPKPPEGTVVWKPNEGLSWIKGRIENALREQRRMLMNRLGSEEFYKLDYPYYLVSDVQGSHDAGKALIGAGYGSEAESWVANYKTDASDDGHDVVVIDAFQNWVPAKPEWVAASEETAAPPTGTAPAPSRGSVVRSETLTPLREAQQERARRLGLSQTTTPISKTGGTRMGRLSDLFQGVELSDEQREAIRQEETRIEGLEAKDKKREADDRKTAADTYLESLKDTPFDNPGTKKYIQSVLLSDDGGPAVEYVELSETGQRTQPKPMTATEIVKGLIDSMPKSQEATLSQQAPRVPGDTKPPVENPGGEEELDLSEKAVKERADALAKEMADEGFEIPGAVVVGGGS